MSCRQNKHGKLLITPLAFSKTAPGSDMPYFTFHSESCLVRCHKSVKCTKYNVIRSTKYFVFDDPMPLTNNDGVLTLQTRSKGCVSPCAWKFNTTQSLVVLL